jgi:thioredoxin-like negative regulator of GroEL
VATCIPLLLMVRGGNEVDRFVGAASKQQLQAWLERHLGAPAGAGP